MLPDTRVDVSPEPIGVDIKFDFEKGDVAGGVGGSLARSHDVVRQWVMASLLTSRETETIYSSVFGSTLREQQAGGLSVLNMGSILPNIIHDALISHDRIRAISNIAVDPTTFDSETITVSFVVLMDDGSSIDFPRVEVT